MELKDLYDPAVKQEVINRINKLSPDSKPQWGKMNVSQMLAHLQMPIGSALGVYSLPRTLFGRIVGPLVKPMMYSEKPFKRNSPTDLSFIMTCYEKDFAKERQGTINMINNFKEENIKNEVHPFFGKMTKEQWSKAMYKHIEHHLQQFGV
ncbi:MAG TPA: DUF1569 domain-containing protein [Chitinophagaceae bacterium]|jgi:hypothetical protein